MPAPQAHTEIVSHAEKISWRDNVPVWVDQWPLTQEKLIAARQLVQEQLAAGHIEPSSSPWNTPIFVIKKKSGKWRLLQDLRAVNKVMVPMGALQPGLPSPAAIPAELFKIIIDLKDCFFTIPLHPEDCHHFAFSIPQVNFQGPMDRFHWRVLPQGMANSPTLAQKYVAQVIQPIRRAWPQIYLLHYMDDILLGGPDKQQAFSCFQQLQEALSSRGLKIAPEKIQIQDPYFYLGYELEFEQIRTPKVELQLSSLKTLHDFQQLLGNLQFIRPYLKIPPEALVPLNELLSGDSHPLSPRVLTPQATLALQQIGQAISSQVSFQIHYASPLYFIVCATTHTPVGVFWQQPRAPKEKGRPLFWVYLPSNPNKVLATYYSLSAALIRKGRKMSRQYFGKDPDIIIVPYTSVQVDWLLQSNDDWAIACASFAGIIDNHYPNDPLIQFIKIHSLTFPKVTSKTPLHEGALVFTDGSSTGKAAYVIQEQVTTIQSPYSSAQLVELFAVLQVFKKLATTPFNLYTDSAYVAHSIPVLETVPYIKPASTASKLFVEIQSLIIKRTEPFFVGHLRAHSGLGGPLSKGNTLADEATRAIFPALIDPIDQARRAHALHHLNASTLRQMFKISRDQAREIVKSCGGCATLLPVPHLGVNPQGLVPNERWQMDVTHLPSFGRLKYLHVTIDTYSGFIHASPLSGEASRDVITHTLQCMATMGKPQIIKTDNGPGYTGAKFQQFCAQFGIKHITGIPYNPQGQGIVERAHQTLKNMLQRLTTVTDAYSPLTPRNRLNHALFVLNFLSLDIEGRSAADRLWHPKSQDSHALV